MTLMVIIGFFALLFGLAFVTKRRFGILGLSLAAGSLLAQYSSAAIGGLLSDAHLTIGAMGYDAFAILLVTVLPSFLLLAGGPTYADKKMAAIGAFGYAALATFFVLAPLIAVAPIADAGTRSVLVMLMTHKTTAMIAGLLLALLDAFLVHSVAGRHLARDKH